MTEIWATLKLIIKFYPEVKAFVNMIKKAANEAQIKRGLSRLERSFQHGDSIEDTADSARRINDEFKL